MNNAINGTVTRQLGRLNTSFSPLGPWGSNDYRLRGEIRAHRNAAMLALSRFRAHLRQAAFDASDANWHWFDHDVEMATCALESAAWHRREMKRAIFLRRTGCRWSDDLSHPTCLE